MIAFLLITQPASKLFDYSERHEARENARASGEVATDQFSFLGNRARYEFLELDMSTVLDLSIPSSRPLTFPGGQSKDQWISLVFWATELDTTLSSSICQPALICRYRARGLSLFRGDKMVIELDNLSSSVKLKQRIKPL